GYPDDWKSAAERRRGSDCGLSSNQPVNESRLAVQPLSYPSSIAGQLSYPWCEMLVRVSSDRDAKQIPCLVRKDEDRPGNERRWQRRTPEKNRFHNAETFKSGRFHNLTNSFAANPYFGCID